jgi:hypothetical protein
MVVFLKNYVSSEISLSAILVTPRDKKEEVIITMLSTLIVLVIDRCGQQEEPDWATRASRI